MAGSSASVGKHVGVWRNISIQQQASAEHSVQININLC